MAEAKPLPNFEEWLESKRINSATFQEKESARFNEWKEAFNQMHPLSFTEQKKFLINPTRLKYPL
jgi:hypothetical protein